MMKIEEDEPGTGTQHFFLEILRTKHGGENLDCFVNLLKKKMIEVICHKINFIGYYDICNQNKGNCLLANENDFRLNIRLNTYIS